jgi:hypothetical protein
MDGYPQKGFFETLFDFTFSEFITARVIKVLYALGIVVGTLMTLTYIIFGFKWGIGTGIVSLIICPLVFLVWVIWLRISLELIIVIFRIGENIAGMARIQGVVPAASAPSPYPPAGAVSPPSAVPPPPPYASPGGPGGGTIPNATR